MEDRVKKRDKRKRRERREMRKAIKRVEKEEPVEGITVKVIRDTRGRQYIKAPDGSVRRTDKVDPGKLPWLAEA